MPKLITKIFGDKHSRDIKKVQPIIDEINRYYDTMHELSDDQLKNKTNEFRNSINEATKDVRQELEEKRTALTSDAYEGKDNEIKIDAEQLRQEISDLEDEEKTIIDKTLNDLLPEAFAVVKETCRRLVGKSWKVCDQEITWNMVPFDVQLIGGIVLHEGKIAEMATGEGKTLVATMPLYLNALPGKGAHLVTVNDYLARRDCE